MWCIGRLTEEYRRRMYGLLDLYARPYRKQEPVVCVDEKSKQLLKHTRPVLPIRPGQLPSTTTSTSGQAPVTSSSRGTQG